MPSGTRPGWRLLARGRLQRSEEAEAIGAVRWLADYGEAIGVRIPNTRERARALGLEEYYASLREKGLGPTALFTAQGNSFDHVAVARRIGQAVRTWLRGGLAERHRYPRPAVVEDIYQQLKAPIEAGTDGGPPLRCQPAAFPADLYSLLVFCRLEGAAPPTAPATARTTPAAVAGREAQ